MNTAEIDDELLLAFKSTLSLFANKNEPIDQFRLLFAIHSYFLHAGIDDLSLRPITNLMFGLADHANGKPNPLIMPVKGKSGQKHSVDYGFQIVAAATLKVLMANGLSKDAAAKKIASRVRTKTGAPTYKQIQSWYNEISSERRAEESDYTSYKLLVDQFLSEDSQHDLAKRLLDALPKMPRLKL